MTVCLYNGSIQKMEENLQFSDRGFLLGDGFFTTIQWNTQKICFWDHHWKRIQKSSAILGIPFMNDSSDLLKDIHQLIEFSPPNVPLAIRLTMTRGNQPTRGLLPPQDLTPNILITASLYKPSSDPVTVGVSRWERWCQSPLSEIKLLNYSSNILAKQEGVNLAKQEMILLNEKGHVSCTTIGNIFLYHSKDGWITPPLKDGCVDGITRHHLIPLLGATERSIIPSEFKMIREGFHCNSLQGVIPFLSLNDQKLAQDLTNQVQKKWKEFN